VGPSARACRRSIEENPVAKEIDVTSPRFTLLDVFTSKPFGGNPLAVFPDGPEVPEAYHQRIARQLDFSETTFVYPPASGESDFRVRIYTPAAEIPFAGHPTVGTAHTLVSEGYGAGARDAVTVRLEEGVGVIPVEVRLEDGRPGRVTMDQPLPQFGSRFEDREAMATLLSLPRDDLDPERPLEVVSCGVPFLFVPLRGLSAVRRVRPRFDLWDEVLGGFESSEVFVFCDEVENEGSSVHARMFAPGYGVPEDPATGSAAGPLGCYLVRNGRSEPSGPAAFRCEQGIEMGRPSFLDVEIDHDARRVTRVRVGGRCVTWGEGRFHLPAG
jgi:trans-2,3-dihydro-3-hydroxyanthranilate isomerase